MGCYFGVLMNENRLEVAFFSFLRYNIVALTGAPGFDGMTLSELQAEPIVSYIRSKPKLPKKQQLQLSLTPKLA